MPIIWRFLLGKYLKVFLLSLISFVAILLVTRLDEIAQFATLGAPVKMVLSFASYQVLYIVPIAVPIACLISSILLFQELSHTHELTALRASGMSLRAIVTPVLFAGLLLGFMNFYTSSELATRSHRLTKQMVNELKAINPLLLLQNQQLMRLKDAYVDIGSLHAGERAQDLLIVLRNRNTKRLNLVSARQMALVDGQLVGEDFSLVTTLDAGSKEQFDHLYIENNQKVHTPSEDFSQLFKESGWRLKNDHLQLPLLLARVQGLYGQYTKAVFQEKTEEMYKAKKAIQSALAEISRRVSAGSAAFTFTLMGAAFGTEISRMRSRKGVLTVVALASLFLICFFSAKGMEGAFALSTALYFIPHFLICGLSVRTLQRVSRGIER